jgi:hypothetical protein
MGFGTTCPDLPEGQAQTFLEQAVPGPEGNALFWVVGDWCFAAHATDPQAGVYHGFPVLGSELDERVLRSLEERGVITRGQRNRLRRQREYPRRDP